MQTASILQDAHNLSPAGKTVCGTLFLMGMALLTLQTLELNRIPSLFQEWQAEKQAESILPSKPEEVAEMIPPFSAPKTEEDRQQRKIALETQLEEFQSGIDHAQIFADTPEELIAQAVCAGRIHPAEAERVLEECKGLNAQRKGSRWITK